MTNTCTQSVSGDSLSHESICGIIIIQSQLKKWCETLIATIRCSPSYLVEAFGFELVPLEDAHTMYKMTFQAFWPFQNPSVINNCIQYMTEKKLDISN